MRTKTRSEAAYEELVRQLDESLVAFPENIAERIKELILALIQERTGA